jgi:membrane protein
MSRQREASEKERHNGNIKERIRRIRKFFDEDVWQIETEEIQSPLRKLLYNLIQKTEFTIVRFTKDRMQNKAAALTYSTLLAVVPILAIVFAIAKGFGVASIIENQLRTNLSSQQELANTLMNFVNSYLAHTKSGIFIGVGLVLLLWTVIMLTHNIECTFNNIWQIKKPRNLFRTITDYTAIFFLLPVLAVASSGLSIFMTTFLKDMPDFLMLGSFMRGIIKLIPFTLTCLMFTGLYVFMPNTLVKFKCAIFPGILAGIAFQFLQYFYINSQIWVSGYNAIYGSFAAIPLFMLWIQISWLICLFGAELTYANQNIKIYDFGQDVNNISRESHDYLCIKILTAICHRFEHGLTPYSANELSTELRIPLRIVNELLYELTEGKILVETAHDEKDSLTHFIPGIDTNNLNLGMLINYIDNKGSNYKTDSKGIEPKAWLILKSARDKYIKDIHDTLFKEQNIEPTNSTNKKP